MFLRSAAYCIFLIFICQSTVFGQQFLLGRIHKKGSSEVVMSVNVLNLTNKQLNESDLGGNFKILASPGDTLAFSSAGYRSDTVIVNTAMLGDTYEVYLEPHVVALAAVTVGGLSNYQLDSAKRKEDYDFIYKRVHTKLLGGNHNGPTDGVGITLSPVSFFSSGEKSKRKLEKHLKQEEQDYYIDYKFPSAYVSKMTGLQGDSLQVFMVKYRPTYKFCRKANSQDILYYISEKIQRYRAGAADNLDPTKNKKSKKK